MWVVEIYEVVTCSRGLMPTGTEVGGEGSEQLPGGPNAACMCLRTAVL